jgi:hypothetical protein
MLHTSSLIEMLKKAWEKFINKTRVEIYIPIE